MTGLTPFDQIRDAFGFLETWEDRYGYVIELGRALPAFDEALRTDANKVRGCASQVWLALQMKSGPDAGRGTAQPVMHFEGDSDSQLVRGLVAILLSLVQDKTAAEVLAVDAHAAFKDLGLGEHLTPQRSNGFASMVARVRADAAVQAGRV